jgi:hypothetical protein
MIIKYTPGGDAFQPIEGGDPRVNACLKRARDFLESACHMGRMENFTFNVELLHQFGFTLTEAPQGGFNFHFLDSASTG